MFPVVIQCGTSYDTRFDTVLWSPIDDPDMIALFNEFREETGFIDTFEDNIENVCAKIGIDWFAIGFIYATDYFKEWLIRHRGFAQAEFVAFDMDDVE